ncbi:MAG: SprT family zinc-dependent metalloprotease [Bacteroidales bacterium]
MMVEKKVYYERVGEVLFRRNRRARNIGIRINSEGQVRVTVPGRCDFLRAEKFVIEKTGWIVRKKESIRKKAAMNLAWEPGAIIEIHNGRIYIEQGTGDRFESTGMGSVYGIMVPADFDSVNPDHTKLLYDFIARIGFQEAKGQLPGILIQYAETYNLPYTKLTVRRMKTRWGSCSPVNNISLNSSLVFLPEALIRYVCLHELVHTVHKNHSQVFWTALTGILPDALLLRKQLRQQSIIA